MNLDNILIVAAQISIVACLFMTIFCIKCLVAHYHRVKIVNAIHRYHMDCFYGYQNAYVEYADMESISKTVYRFWDWTGKRILPEEKMELIKPFIK